MGRKLGRGGEGKGEAPRQHRVRADKGLGLGSVTLPPQGRWLLLGEREEGDVAARRRGRRRRAEAEEEEAIGG